MKLCAAGALVIAHVAMCSQLVGAELALDDLFPSDRVVDIQVKVAKGDWNKIRRQSRSLFTELSPKRIEGLPKRPYTWVEVEVTIDGVDCGRVGLRKKGFIGSLSSSRPSLKIKLDYVDKDANIDGLSVLTFNNNKQDETEMSQVLGYRVFRDAGSPAPRCGFARITVNGENLGIYSHVETPRKPLLRRAFDDDRGTLFEGTVVDFRDGWAKTFEKKIGKRKRGMERVHALIDAVKRPEGQQLLPESTPARIHVPSSDEHGKAWTQPDFDDSIWTETENGLGYDIEEGYREILKDRFDVRESMRGKNATIYVRIPFELEDVSRTPTTRLVLRVMFDDGFVAYLNGHPVADDNEPDNLSWNSKASEGHADSSAKKYQEFDLTRHWDKLRTGSNVLAIHGLNAFASSSDFLLVPQLTRYDKDYEKAIAEVVDLDAFYRFWALEGLVSFWDGYAANRNNYFVYAKRKDGKLYFMPWGADCMFETFSPIDADSSLPTSYKATGTVCFRLVQNEESRARYVKTMRTLLDEVWHEDQLLAEVDRMAKVIEPHLSRAQKTRFETDSLKKFIRERRQQILDEVEDGLPKWKRPQAPAAIIDMAMWQEETDDDHKAPSASKETWAAINKGDVQGIQRHLDDGGDVNARDAATGSTLVSAAALAGQLNAIRYLIARGGDINAPNNTGLTPLHAAAYLGRIDVAELLIASGADVDAKNDKGKTPLEMATMDWKIVERSLSSLSKKIDAPLDKEAVKTGREKVADVLRAKTNEQEAEDGEEDADAR